MSDQSWRGPPRPPADGRYQQKQPYGANQPPNSYNQPPHSYQQPSQQGGYNAQQHPSSSQYRQQPPQQVSNPPLFPNPPRPSHSQTAPSASVPLFPHPPIPPAPAAANNPHVVSQTSLIPDPVASLPPGIVVGPQGLQATDGRPIKQVLPWIPSSNALGSQGQLAVALVCQSNVNRSVETHHILTSNGYKFVFSYGVGSKVRMPGEKINTPNIFEFGTPYLQMHHELRKRNQSYYAQNGCLAMLQRDAQVKGAPERFQDTPMKFDIIITFEKRVFDIVVEDIMSRNTPLLSCTHVINIETPDNHEEARNASFITLQLLNYIHSLIPASVGDKPVSSALTAPAVLNPVLAHLPKPEGAQDHADMVLASDAIYTAFEQLETGMGEHVHHTVVWY